MYCVKDITKFPFSLCSLLSLALFNFSIPVYKVTWNPIAKPCYDLKPVFTEPDGQSGGMTCELNYPMSGDQTV